MIHVIRYLLEGDGSVPKFVQDGGYFPSGDEILGVSVDDAKRHLPSTVIKLTRAELLTWVSALNLVDDDNNPLDAEELVENFLASKNMEDYA